MEDPKAEEAWFRAHRDEIDQIRKFGNCTMYHQDEKTIQTNINNDVDAIRKFHDYNCCLPLLNGQNAFGFDDSKYHDNFDFLLGVICGLLISNQRSDEK